jgi:parvulin-like peptidyl-prolyl isomerase
MSTRRRTVRVWSGILAGCLGVAFGVAGTAEPQLLNGIAAKVNGKIITQEEIASAISVDDRQLLLRLYGRQTAVLEEKMRQLQQDALDQLVERELILHEFETAGYQLPESVIDEYLKGIIRERFGDRLNLIKELQLKGRTVESFRREIRADYIVQAMRQRNVSASVLVSPYKIESYYEQNTNQFRVDDQIRLRMIFVANKPDRPAEVSRALAEEILAKIEQGAPFKEMAAVYSDGAQRAEAGDWGWIEPSKLNEDLAKVAATLKPGEHSGIIEMANGCYLMRVEEFRDQHVRSLAEVRDEIEKTLLLQERQRLYKQWIERLKAKSFVSYYPLVAAF